MPTDNSKTEIKAAKITGIAIIIAALISSFFIFIKTSDTEPTKKQLQSNQIQQTTKGDQSPTINAIGDININYNGPTIGQFEEKLNATEERLLKELQSLRSDPNKMQEHLLRLKLKAVQKKLFDLKTSYEEEKKNLKAAEEALQQFKEELPIALIEKAQVNLQQGNTEVAEKAFDDIVNKGSGAIATAAYHSGQLAKSRLDYGKAMKQYKIAVTLRGNNPEYLLEAGLLSKTLGDIEQAQQWIKRLLIIRVDENKYDYNLSVAQNALAETYMAQSNIKDAGPLYKQALSIAEKTVGKYHLQTAVILNNLGLFYGYQNEFEESERMLKRSLAIKEKILRKDHPSIATTMNNLAILYRKTGNYTQAEILLKQSLSIKIKWLEKDPLGVGVVLNNLAGIYELQRKYNEAEVYYKHDLSILEDKFKKDHPAIASNLNNLAGLYEKQGKYIEAENLYKRSLAILEDKYRKDYNMIAIVLNNLGDFYRITGNYKKSESLIKQSLLISEETHGLDSIENTSVLNSLALLYSEQNKFKEAEVLYQRTISIFYKTFPNGHPHLRIIIYNYESLKRKMDLKNDA